MCFLLNRRTDAVGTEEQHGTFRHFIERLDENHSARPQPADNVVVVHKFMQRVDRFGKMLQQLICRGESTTDTGTHPMRNSEINFSFFLHSVIIAPPEMFFKVSPA